MPEAPNFLVELHGVSKHFGEGDTRVDALVDISMSVAPGEVVGLVGPSGSGKTTLLNVIGCITEPNSGSIRLNGDAVFDGKWLSRNLRRLRLEKIGFIFQTHNLLPFLNATENVMEVMELAGVTPAAARTRHRPPGVPAGRTPTQRDACTAVRGRGTARRHCPGACQQSENHSCRRTDGSTRFRTRGYRHGSATPDRGRSRGRDHRGHARREHL